MAGIADTAGDPVVLDTHASSSLPAALVRMTRNALHDDPAVGTDEQALVELVSVLAAGRRVSATIAHRAAARAFIDDNLHRPDLAAALIAQATGISERTLSRVFADAETTVPRYVLKRRLDLALSLLVRRPELRTVDVAARAGFTSKAHFSQSFERQFGLYAGEVRRGARPEGSHLRQDSSETS